MKIPIYTVDAFTDKLFSGNPAAVCVLDNALGESEMQQIAFEMNLSETAFLYKTNGEYSLRWFTPAAEVELCGHATLASSHILWKFGYIDPKECIVFKTKSGILTVSMKDGMIEMDFPLIPNEEISPNPMLEKALGATPVYLGKTKWNYIAEMDSEKIVREIKPDFELLKTLESWGTIITAKATMDGYDFVSRFFAPEKGVMEDPVTGSAHCALGPYWQKKTGRSEFKAYQASVRSGTVYVRVEGNRVFLKGNAVTVLEGSINI